MHEKINIEMPMPTAPTKVHNICFEFNVATADLNAKEEVNEAIKGFISFLNSLNNVSIERLSRSEHIYNNYN